MKKMLKRLAAVLCAATLVIGACLTDGKQVVKADNDTAETPEVQEYTAAKPGEAPSGLKDGYVFGGWYTDQECKNVLTEEVTATDNRTVYAKIVPEEVLSVQAQYQISDGVIAEGEYTENTAAKTRAEITLNDPVDISAYRKGRLHFKIYVDDSSKINGNLEIELGDSEGNRLSWSVYYKRFKSGEQTELDLSFAAASSATADFNYKKVNYFHVVKSGTEDQSYTTTISDIRAVASLPGMLLEDCEDKDDVTTNSSCQVTSDAEYVKDGQFAFHSNTTSDERLAITFNHAVDLSEYKDDGTLHFWLYVGDIAAWQKTEQVLRIQFFDANNSGQWVKAPSELSAGWNEVELKLSENSRYGSLDWSNITKIRMHTGTYTANMTFAIDDIRIIPALERKTILDGEDGETNISAKNNGCQYTTDTKYVKVGKGAFYSQTSGAERFSVTFKEGIDLTEYKKGTLHFWLYVGDITAWQENKSTFRIQFFNAGKSAQWNKAPSELISGWNEIELKLSEKADSIDWSNVTQIRMHTSGFTGALTLSVDDVCAIAEEIAEDEYISQSAAIRFLTTVDSLKYQNVGFKITVNKTLTASSTCVYEKLTGKNTDGTTVTLEPSTTFHANSRYFSTWAVYNIPRSAFAKGITVTPYWTTQDGTVVYGTAATFRVREMQNN